MRKLFRTVDLTDTLNATAGAVFGQVTTTNVYIVAVIGMTVAAVIVIVAKARKKTV